MGLYINNNKLTSHCDFKGLLLKETKKIDAFKNILLSLDYLGNCNFKMIFISFDKLSMREELLVKNAIFDKSSVFKGHYPATPELCDKD